MRTHDPAFVPPFCPRTSCIHHVTPVGDWHVRFGTYTRRCEPRVIRRFKCKACGREFSTQTFDTTYFLKRPDLQKPLFHGLVACSGLRQLGRSWGVAHSTLQRQASRLGRHCLLFERVRGPGKPPTEPLAADGFVTFEYSQYWPFEINTLVGRDSHYVHAITESELRRSGRMTEAQKQKRATLEAEFGTPDPQATRKAIEALVLLAAPEPAPLDIFTDEHAAYPRAFKRLPHAITHRTVSSRRCRTALNPLFAVDLLDLLLRHGGSNHKRETIAFSKRRQGALERAAVTQVWRNHVKRVRENDARSPTPAMTLGLATQPLTADDVLLRRLLPSHVTLPEPLRSWYWRDVETRQIPNGTRHALAYAA
jgi:transposase-like protein